LKQETENVVEVQVAPGTPVDVVSLLNGAGIATKPLLPGLPNSGNMDMVSLEVVASWVEDMELMIGTIIHKFGSRAVDVSLHEIKKFSKHRTIEYKSDSKGNMRYEIVKRKGVKS
jgi:hypothetical protein